MMALERRYFSESEKLKILESAEQQGVTAVLREYRLSYSVFVKWKRKYGKEGGAGKVVKRMSPELKHLLEENGRLRRIIAEQALEIERKEEEIRKYNALYGKR
jgi:putative transposase